MRMRRIKGAAKPERSSAVFSAADHHIDFVAMDVAVNAVAGALKAFFADLPDPLIPYSLHPELVEAASKNTEIYSDRKRKSLSAPHEGGGIGGS